MMKTMFATMLLLGATAQGAVTLFDFETPAAIAAAPAVTNASFRFAVEAKGATHGTNALHWVCTPWKQGLDEWPSCTMTPSVTNWKEYDRLCVDIVNHGSDFDSISAYLAGPEGRVQTGLLATFALPPCTYSQWIIPLANWPKTANPANITRVHFFTTHARSFDLHLDRITLLKKGEKPPMAEGPGFTATMMELYRRNGEAMARMRAESEAAKSAATHLESYWRFREQCAIAGQRTSEMCVGEASSMTKVLPRGVFRAEPVQQVNVRLARREKESVQLLVAAGDRDLTNVTVKVERDLVNVNGPRFPSDRVTCAVMGYVETKKAPPYKVGYKRPGSASAEERKTHVPMVGWWPDPILDHLHATDVKGRDVQSFWVRVNCPEKQAAGVYWGQLVVSADGVAPRKIPFSVRVYDFEVPKKSPLPLAVSFSPGYSMQFATPSEMAESKRIKADPSAPVNIWKKHRAEWCDFLADYYITMDSIYHHATVDAKSNKTQDAAFYPDQLLRLKAQGRLDCFNLGYWSRLGKGEQALANWRKSHLPRIRSAYEFAKRNGILDKAFIYGCDEAPKNEHPEVQLAVQELKKEFPGVPIFTTAYDHEFGVNTSLACMDWFTPLTPRYNRDKAAAARKQGRQVWWYICCGPRSPHANMFIENAAIEGRILMGAQTVKMRPDGFLYYAIALWNSPKPIAGNSAFTDWTARSWTTFHGDGSWTCCGPDGIPVATQRLENFRDGLEDYAYALELERRLKACKEPNGEWAKQARALLAVPAELSATMTAYTDDPAVVRKWRDGMASLIENTPVASSSTGTTGVPPVASPTTGTTGVSPVASPSTGTTGVSPVASPAK